MKQKTIEYHDEELNVSLVIGRATVRTKIEREKLSGQAFENSKPVNPDLNVHYRQAVIYPACIAATLEAPGLDWPLSFDQFLDLPDELVDAWYAAVLEVNPHWSTKSEEPQADIEKKAPTSTNA